MKIFVYAALNKILKNFPKYFYIFIIYLGIFICSSDSLYKHLKFYYITD